MVAELAGIGSLRGVHNAQNAACAVAACVALGIDLGSNSKRSQQVSRPRASHAAGRAQGQRAVRQRLESDQCRIRRPKPWRAFTTSFGSRAASRKPAESSSLAEFFPRIRKAYLIGEAAENLPRRWTARCPTRSTDPVSGNRRGCSRRRSVGLEGTGGLLSPACASFDQYPNFEVRGKAFTDIVLGLGVTPIERR